MSEQRLCWNEDIPNSEEAGLLLNVIFIYTTPVFSFRGTQDSTRKIVRGPSLNYCGDAWQMNDVDANPENHNEFCNTV